MRFVKYNGHICLGQAYHCRLCTSRAKPLHFKAMPKTTVRDVARMAAKSKGCPTISVEDMLLVVEEYLRDHGCESLQYILDLIEKEQITWVSRPKVSLFRSKCARSILLKVALGPKHKESLGRMALSL